jgi:FHA domain
MTVLCPAGHESVAADWCDQCGARIGATSPASPVKEGPAPAGSVAAPVLPEDEVDDTARSPAREPCPACGAARSGDDRYCEGCGYDLLSRGPVAVWEVRIEANRAWFERNGSDQIAFPDGYVEWRVGLDAEQLTIGRSRADTETPPAIDLIGEHADPGVSRAHARLERLADGSYAVLDLGSMNGTTVNDDQAPITARAPVPLKEGDRVHVGAWTTLTIRHRERVEAS